MSFDPAASDEFVFICPARLNCVLAAADAAEIPELSLWCDGLPADSYGQVFVEVNSRNEVADLAPLRTPAGVSVAYIARDERHADTGYALAAAVDAWLDEWVRVDFESERRVQLWAGARSTDAMRCYWQRLEQELASA